MKTTTTTTTAKKEISNNIIVLMEDGQILNLRGLSRTIPEIRIDFNIGRPINLKTGLTHVKSLTINP